ncbi:sn-glycerol-3-phosphate ABC transporter ATP-binding protein UgpC [Mesorhizobium sp. WSM4307]|uniref:ABC transporter ATP-binding protein n=1 Tax=unclassified Mesorhizobium TaxID=325217 RepID=UPI000BAF97C2|nr:MULTISPECIES: sn-glycerol-3-phosphate ABC transporter ATP-binding protein UgpC [unclassified Mesorhizobium]PBB24558.1 sugar ABC transporter ATP-binding protein [Mesorhizobium sp. WSM4304]PBB74767.1 sugar ABC transporter ATP-binding protein [Mesorhizobium sp. WSM4308]TRC73291.1 sn-glycerol-3-phosphate ABC transporter ATP-binding protein UgpC [Mesorhizobium sp. WSM4315]TRC83570.1 sn-glycerol-3-phosphate ABC transporter ATP-binding protein UgpC [Mesorhizobium sp. WSM4307]
MSKVSLSGIRKSYGALEVLHGIDLEVREGEFIVLVGPSGCGKSTLLRMIAGLESVTSGVLRIDGRVVNDVETRERDIAMVFQSYALYPHMSVAENIGFPLRVRSVGSKDASERVSRTADMIGLSRLLDRKPRQLSGGQRQRVAMGRAIIRDPKLFLFDEPLSNLDAKLRGHIRAQIRQLHRELGATSIYVTHDQVEAMTLADRIVLLKDGVCQQIGSPLDLYSKPANTFAASFIGSPEINLVHGICRGSKEGPMFDGPGFAERIPPSLHDAVCPGSAITLGIRPEHLEVQDAGDFKARVKDTEYLGVETLLICDLGGQELVARVPGRCEALGREVGLSIKPRTSHFFDTATGVSLG